MSDDGEQPWKRKWWLDWYDQRGGKSSRARRLERRAARRAQAADGAQESDAEQAAIVENHVKIESPPWPCKVMGSMSFFVGCLMFFVNLLFFSVRKPTLRAIERSICWSPKSSAISVTLTTCS